MEKVRGSWRRFEEVVECWSWRRFEKVGESSRKFEKFEEV